MSPDNTSMSTSDGTLIWSFAILGFPVSPFRYFASREEAGPARWVIVEGRGAEESIAKPLVFPPRTRGRGGFQDA